MQTRTDGKNLTLILPTLNEEGNIAPLIAAILQRLPFITIVVVDDHSQDNTAGIVRAIAAANPKIFLIQRPPPACLTDSIQAGINFAQTEWVAWMDADFSHPPQLLPELFETAQLTGCCIASRYKKGFFKSAARDFHPKEFLVSYLSKILNLGTRLLLRIKVTDFTSGYIVIKKSLLQTAPLKGDYGEYFIVLMAQISPQIKAIPEIPYESTARQWGVSKTGAGNLKLLISRGLKYLALLARLFFYARS